MSGPTVSSCDTSSAQPEQVRGAAMGTFSAPQSCSFGSSSFGSLPRGFSGRPVRFQDIAYMTRPNFFNDAEYASLASRWSNRPKPQPIHPNHQCDGCRMTPIVGDRYHCMHPACVNFDLCGSCKARGDKHHSSHELGLCQNAGTTA